MPVTMVDNPHLAAQTKQFLITLADGELSASAYDTAFVARLAQSDGTPLFPESIAWLEQHQLEDGSWGSPDIHHIHDRVICTMAAIFALTKWQPQSATISAAVDYLNQHLNQLDFKQYATVGFELAFPMLYRELIALGISLNINPAIVEAISAKVERKLAMLDIYKYKSTLLHTLEFWRGREIDFERLLQFQEQNGSFGCSPASTAFVFEHTDNQPALAYLRDLVQRGQGAVPALYPIDIFERNWIINSFIELDLHSDFLDELRPQVDYLHQHWTDRGVGFSRYFGIPDIDDSVVSYTIFNTFGLPVKPDFLRNFESEEGFYCYRGELDSSPTHNANLVTALVKAPDFESKQDLLAKAIRTFKASFQDSYFDKWHISPYYTYSRLIFNDVPELAAVEQEVYARTLSSQKSDGGWGYFAKSTAEETAFAVFTLLKYRQKDPTALHPILEKAYNFLAQNHKSPNMWLGKSLYSSAITKFAPLQAQLAIIKFSQPQS